MVISRVSKILPEILQYDKENRNTAPKIVVSQYIESVISKFESGCIKAILISGIMVEINKPLLFRDPVTDFSWARKIVRTC